MEHGVTETINSFSNGLSSYHARRTCNESVLYISYLVKQTDAQFIRLVSWPLVKPAPCDMYIVSS